MNQNPGQSGFFSLLKGVALNRVLIVLFLLQILLAVGLTAYLSISNGQKAANEVASQWRYEVANRVEQNLHTYLSASRQLLRGNQNIVDLGLLKMQNLVTWESYLIKQLKIFPDVVAITASNEQREYLTVQKLSDGQFLLRKAGKSTRYNLYTYKINRKGQRTQLPEVIKNYDARSQPNYQAAVNEKKFSFTQILTPLTEPTLMLGASQPIYNSQNKLLGVNSTLTNLSQIEYLLQNIKVGKSGQILIIEPSGKLIASSTTKESFPLQENLLTQATAKYLVTKFNNFNQIKSLQQLDFSFAGKRHFLEVRPLPGEPNLNWLIVVAVPEVDLMGQIERNTQTTIVLCLGVLGLASILRIVIARWITLPILDLSKAAKELGKRATSSDFTNEEDSMVVVDGIYEVEVLAYSFNEMAQQLRATFNALANKNQELELQTNLQTQELQEEIKKRINSEEKEVTERKQAELALREAKETAEVANRAKNTFLANMSDDLKTPLNSILEITKTFQDEEGDRLNKEQRQSLDSLESNGKHLLELINDILDLSKIQSSKIELQLAPTSIQGLCDASLSFVKHWALQKNIQLSLQIPEGLEPIQVDERRIRQAFINLLSNAVKFTHDGGKVWIEVQPTSTNEYIFFSVVDTGIGMLSDDLFKLFQPFVQVENSSVRRSGGTGLGLVMVQRIVELHGGTVHAESQLGRGSRFTIKLPWKK